MPPTDRLITPQEAANMLGVSERTVRRWFTKGTLDGRRYPNATIRIWWRSVRRLIHSSETAAARAR